MPFYVVARLQAEFSGVGGGWTELHDVRRPTPITIEYGISGVGPQHRVADTGEMSFALNNAANNSGGVLGYYTIGGPNCRAGFDLGIRVRAILTCVEAAGPTEIYKFIGTIDEANVATGQYADRDVRVKVVDWMEEAARFDVRLEAAIGTKANEVIDRIINAVPIQPNAKLITDGSDWYEFAPAGGQITAATAEFQRIMITDQGRLVIRGGPTAAEAGTVCYFSRNAFLNTSLATVKATLTGADLTRTETRCSRKGVINVFRMIVHQRRADQKWGDPVVLFTLENENSIDPSEVVLINGKFKDPTLAATKVSGYGMLPPVAGVDYKFTSIAGGGGTDLTADLDVSVEYGSDSAAYVIQNTGGVTGFLVLLQARGYGLYDYDPVEVEVRDAASVTANGEIPITLDMWYVGDVKWARQLASYMLPYWKDPTTRCTAVQFSGNKSADAMVAALGVEPCDRVVIQETVSAVNQSFTVQKVKLHISEGGIIDCTWTLTPQVDTTAYWLVEEPGSSLDANTIIGP